MGFEVRSSDLEMGLLFSGDIVRVEIDTIASVPSSSQPSVSRPPGSFHAFKEKCSLGEEAFNRFRDRF